jgi:dienelactone hydrolase
MRQRRVRTAVLAAALAALVNAVPGTGSANAPGVPKTACDVPAGEPEPGTAQYLARDLQNIACAGQKVYVDQLVNPAYTAKDLQEIPGSYLGVMQEQIANAPRFSNPVFEYVPGANVADPFRQPDEWQAAGRGSYDPFYFLACNGARRTATLWIPSTPKPAEGYPGIVISTGAVQAFQEIYFWAAQGLAEAGYMVLTYDVQGQGRSEMDPDPAYAMPNATCDDSVYTQGMRDGLRWLRSNPSNLYRTAAQNPRAGTSSFNPHGADVDLNRIGIAGHSAGAAAVSLVGQEDPGVKAIVAWDCLREVPDDDIALIHAHALAICSEYGFTQDPPKTAAPSRDFKAAAFKQIVAHDESLPEENKVDTMLVIPRASTHLEYDYVPLVFPATRYGERVAMYYTLAWFDRYVKGDTSATARLTATRFDDSADRSSIGAGTYDAATNSNVPYEIEGDCTSNRLSFYYASRFNLAGGAVLSDDMQHMEPNTDPSTYCGAIPEGVIAPL